MLPPAGLDATLAGLPLVLFLSVLLIAACGLIYELIAGTLASYLLGDVIVVEDLRKAP